jgi:tryptophanyl-tRNA synthetase
MRLFSGIQPSGRLHLGNYFGAIKNWVELNQQHKHNSFYCLVDLHAQTSIPRTNPFDPNSQRTQSLELATALLACGLNPETCTIYRQSQVPYHAHLQWLLSCRTPLRWLDQMTQFKTKVKDLGENSSNLGLFSYPVLMAADIMLVSIPIMSDRGLKE